MCIRDRDGGVERAQERVSAVIYWQSGVSVHAHAGTALRRRTSEHPGQTSLSRGTYRNRLICFTLTAGPRPHGQIFLSSGSAPRV
eukprot:3832935-Pyramimonas_sp.AAC.1